MRYALAVATALVAFGITPAFANQGGLAGYSGKPTIFAPAGESCNQCHTGGATPTVALNGPNTLAAGQSAEYTLVVTTGLSRAGAGIAATDGTVLAPLAGLRDSFGEMVQNAPVTVSGGSATFRFRVTAPLVGTSLKLWAVGLGSNNANAAAGDRAAHTTKDVTITGGAPPPPPPPADAGSSGGNGEPPPGSDGGVGSSGGSSGGTSGGSSGGKSGSNATPGGGDGDGDDGDGDGDGTGSSRGARGDASGVSCTTTPSSPVSPVESAPMTVLGGLALAGIIGIARRRRPHA